MKVKCKFCVNLKKGWCNSVNDCPDADLERECEFFVRAKVYDALMNMDEDDFAAWLCDIFDGRTCSRLCPARGECTNYARGMYTWLENKIFEGDELTM